MGQMSAALALVQVDHYLRHITFHRHWQVQQELRFGYKVQPAVILHTIGSGIIRHLNTSSINTDKYMKDHTLLLTYNRRMILQFIIIILMRGFL